MIGFGIASDQRSGTVILRYDSAAGLINVDQQKSVLALKGPVDTQEWVFRTLAMQSRTCFLGMTKRLRRTPSSHIR